MPNGSHKRILVVDDDVEVRRILSTTLARCGLTVDLASGGREALDFLRANAYAVVLLDLLMPGLDGFAVLDAIRDEPPVLPPVVLVVSGADRASVERLDAERIHGIVRKPFDPDDLARLVLACSEVKRRRALETMAIAVMSTAPLLAWLNRFGS